VLRGGLQQFLQINLQQQPGLVCRQGQGKGPQNHSLTEKQQVVAGRLQAGIAKTALGVGLGRAPEFEVESTEDDRSSSHWLALFVIHLPTDRCRPGGLCAQAENSHPAGQQADLQPAMLSEARQDSSLL
jgi:hypothetical protein